MSRRLAGMSLAVMAGAGVGWLAATVALPAGEEGSRAHAPQQPLATEMQAGPAAPATAPEPSAPPPTPAPSEPPVVASEAPASKSTGEITGHVRVADGRPLAGVTIRAMLRAHAAAPRPDEQDLANATRESVARRAIEAWHRDEAAVRWATTDVDGAYRLDRLLEGEHHLEAWAAGYLLQGEGQQYWKARPGTVVEFTAMPAAEIEIVVELPDGDLPATASVGQRIGGGGHGSVVHQWQPPSLRLWLEAGEHEFWATTPSPPGLPEGSRMVAAPERITARASGAATRVVLRTRPEVESADSRAAVPPTARERRRIPTPNAPGGTLRVRIATPDDTPLADAVLGLDMRRGNAGNGHRGLLAVPERDGTLLVHVPEDFREVVSGAAPDAAEAVLWLELESPRYGNTRVRVVPGSRDPVTIPLTEPAWVTVRLQGYVGHALEGEARVSLVRADVGRRETLAPDSGSGAPGVPDPEGQLRAGPLQPGDWVVQVAAVVGTDFGHEPSLSAVASVPVTLRPGTQTVDVPLPGLNRLTVRVAGADADTQVWLHGDGRRASQPVDANGLAVFERLPSGDYTIRLAWHTHGRGWPVSIPGDTEVSIAAK